MTGFLGTRPWSWGELAVMIAIVSIAMLAAALGGPAP
jgi:hypothetical protein